MDKYYEKNKVNPPPGAIFRAKTNYATITAYKSGKVLFQGKQPLVESEKWQAEDKSEQTSLFTAAKPSTQSPPKTVFKNSHIGYDESGTGDYFGTITTCAMLVNKEKFEQYKVIGLHDIKQI